MTINIIQTLANMTPYSIDSSDDHLEDAVATLNRLIHEAKAQLPTQHTNALEAMRANGWAVAAYGVDDLADGPVALEDESVTPAHYAAFAVEHREAIEDAMCEAVWSYCNNVQLVGDTLEHV